MTFNSLQFIIFFILVTLLYFRLQNQKGRIVLLLVASCYFYMSFIPEYILILGGTIVFDYFAGIKIEASAGNARKTWLLLSIVVNVGTLCVFKYFNFFVDNIHAGMQLFGKPLSIPLLRMALPLGLSFHTFQAMSYTIEVYRGSQRAERNFTVYSLYVMFYPQLVAGPIERPQHILPQLKEFRPYNRSNVKEGLARMLWGFFKKVVIADRLAMVVDHTFSHSYYCSSLALFTGAVFYSFQIYCDFSGYSDIALGAAKVMNISLMENFNQPYRSRSISEFWSRWHISLSSWFRDYIYVPLGGNRKGKIRRKANVLVVFLVSGLWHGANLTFVVWGLLHGLLVTIFAGKTKKLTKTKAGKTAGMLFTFLLVTFLWVFFRAERISDACNYIADIFAFRSGTGGTGQRPGELVFSVLLIVVLLLRERYRPKHYIADDKRFYLYIISMTALCYYLGVFAQNQFIYFQF